MEGQTGRSAEKAGTATPDPEATLRASADLQNVVRPPDLSLPIRYSGTGLGSWLVGGRMSFNRLRAARELALVGGVAAKFSLIWPLGARAAADAAGDRPALKFYAVGFRQLSAASPGPERNRIFGGRESHSLVPLRCSLNRPRKCQRMAIRPEFAKVA
jgi:hypothetical protein